MKCELCGSPVKVAGESTQHYEPDLPSEEEIAKFLANEVVIYDGEYAAWYTLDDSQISIANEDGGHELLAKAIYNLIRGNNG